MQFLIGMAASNEVGARYTATVKLAAAAQALFVVFAFAMLIWVFVDTDLSVKLVAANSHVDKPMLYKVAAAWGNHEGSMLLWVTVLSVCGALIAVFEHLLDRRTLAATLSAQGAISLGFFTFLLFVSNPFIRLDPPAPTGLGLNPLLQDPGLAFHPPTLYFGYVGLSVAFSFAVGALVTRTVNRDFALAVRPWVLMAWIFLTIGITAGSYWAYYELGWGGWWFWDPVENASLMPWLAATALLHSVSVLAARDSLRAWTIMLSVLAFSMSMVGTFLVRSGVLTSVHSFAVDPGRGAFILALLVLYIGGALTLFGLRIGTVSEGKRFSLISRELSLVANNLLLTSILFIVLIGTLYPIVAEAMGAPISVGPPWFNAVTAPFAFVMFIIMGIGPLTNWRKDSWSAIWSRIAVPVTAAILTLIAMLIFAPGVRIFPLLGLTFAVWLAVSSLAPLWGRNLRRTPLTIWGMVVAHLGIAVSLAGMASDAAFTKERLVAVRVGETVTVGPWQARLESVVPAAGHGWTALEGKLVVWRGNDRFDLEPQQRYFISPPTVTSEAAIQTRWNGQIYAVMGAEDGQGRWQLRLWWKPFVTLIWLGGALIALGGFLALLSRVARNFAEVQRRIRYD